VPTGPSDEPTLGAALRAARETAGRSVEQVSAHTCIRATLIRDLEADRFGSSGGAVYARGHIKSIARVLGTDPAPLLALFDRVQEQAAPLLIDSAPELGPVTSFGGSAFAAGVAASLTPERRGPRWGLALTGAGAVLLVIIAVGSLSSPGSKPPTVALGAEPSATPSASTPAGGVQTPNPDSVAAKPAVTGAQLRLRLIGGDSWVSVSNATSTLFEGTLHDGQFRDFNDPNRLKVVVGNGLAVNLNCGGRDSGPAGSSGSVKRFACTAAGLTAL
jgi:hypothetical protein